MTDVYYRSLCLKVLIELTIILGKMCRLKVTESYNT